ncbi:MAG: ATP-binding cassette domain-containing protein [Actinobacteria bacterium]|nr:ATP-binding cassette domain-containing protein [Actinomycetota bacterium]
MTSVKVPAVAVEGLTYTYPDGTEALSQVDLVIEEGESVAVIGPNGAGKSTLLLHLNGILRGGGGRVLIFGVPIEERTLRETRRRVGVVFQDPDDQLFLTTVFQDVAFGPANMGLGETETATRVHEALEAVDMSAFGDRAAHHLSFGQKKRVATATVLSMRPDVLVLDEPSSNLDPRSRRKLVEILRDLPVTKVIVTHDLVYAYETCGRAVILDAGRVVADGPASDILTDGALLELHGLELPFRPHLPAPTRPTAG